MQETKVQEVAKEQFEEVAYLLKALASEIRLCVIALLSDGSEGRSPNCSRTLSAAVASIVSPYRYACKGHTILSPERKKLFLFDKGQASCPVAALHCGL